MNKLGVGESWEALLWRLESLFAFVTTSAAFANKFGLCFQTEWQTYVQQIEGESWRGEKMDKSKVDKMSGRSTSVALGCEMAG